MPSTLLIRADASPAIGVGHAMRCLALAQAWQDGGGGVVWFAREMPASLAARLRREGVALHLSSGPVGGARDAGAVRRLARRSGAAWIAVDGYRFGPAYLGTLHGGGPRLLAIDDMAHLEHYPVDVLLNQNEGASAASYAGKLGASVPLLLGARHSLLRREFRAGCAPRPARAGRRLRLLVTMGGSDPVNATQTILGRLAAGRHAHLHVAVVAGAANPHVAALRAATARAPYQCELHVAVDSLAPLMAWADAAIAAAGSTVWELAAMELPALVGAGEGNQFAVLRGLGAIPFFRAGAMSELLNWNLADELDALLARPVDAAWRSFGAAGAARVVETLRGRSALAA